MFAMEDKCKRKGLCWGKLKSLVLWVDTMSGFGMKIKHYLMPKFILSVEIVSTTQYERFNLPLCMPYMHVIAMSSNIFS
jgi:hypothetical protein